MSFAHENPYGSARYATGQEIAQAKLFEERGLPFGFYEGRALHHHSMAGMAISVMANRLTTIRCNVFILVFFMV